MITIVPNLRAVVDQDGAIILNTARNQITTVDAIGGYIWSMLEDGIPPREIVSLLAQETGENATVVEADMCEFLEELQTKHLVIDITPRPTTLEPL